MDHQRSKPNSRSIMYKLIFLFLFTISCQNNDSKLTAIPASHIGEWETGCYSNGGGTYGKINLIIDTTSIELTTGVFSDVNCNTQLGEFYLESDSYVRTLNTYSTTLNTYQLTPMTNSYATGLNLFGSGTGFCGITNWANATPRNIFGLNCVGNDPAQINDGDSFTIEAVRTEDTLETDYTTEIFYKI